jgi:hypothetical protein
MNSTTQKSSNNRGNSSYERKNTNTGNTSNILCRKGQDCHFNKQGRCMFFHPQRSQQTITKPSFTYCSSDFPSLSSVK